MSITLYVVRHAKAQDRALYMTDHDRQLVTEGIVAATKVGRYLDGKAVRPDVIISSTAPRAKDTAKIVAEQLGFDPVRIQLDESLFGGGPKAYLAAINALPAGVQSVMVVGHNPDVSYFVEYLTHEDIGSMSKGAVVAISFEDLDWSHVSSRTGRLVFQIKPKDLPN